MEPIVTPTDLQHKLARKDNDIVCVKFTAKWCRPCANVQPVLAELATKHPHIHVYTADVDHAHELMNIYSIQAMPTFIFFQNNETVYALKGADAQALTIAFEVADGIRGAQARSMNKYR